MKRTKIKYMAIAAIVAVIGLISACYEVTEIRFPENPEADSDIEVHAVWKFNCITDSQNDFVIAVLVPASWEDFETRTKAYFSCEQIGVQDLELTPVDGDTCPGADWGGLTMRQWYSKNIGDFGNQYGNVKWYFFISGREFAWVNEGKYIGDVKFIMHTGPESMVFNMGFGTCKYPNGPHMWSYPTVNDNQSDLEFYRAEKCATINISGGNGFVDFLNKPLVSTSPTETRYGDLFAVNFAAGIEGNETELKGEDKVYACFVAQMKDGTVKTYDKKGKDNLMKKLADDTYKRYVYIPQLLNIKSASEIDILYVYFENEDGSKKVTHSSLPGYVISQSKKSIQ